LTMEPALVLAEMGMENLLENSWDQFIFYEIN